MRVQNMTGGKPLKLILGIAMPLMLGNVFQQLYTVVDASIVGKGIGVAALAALGASDWFNWLCLGVASGFTQGFTIPMAQAFGAEDYDELRKNVASSIILSVLCAIVLTAGSLLLINPVLDLLGTPMDIRPMAVDYLTVLFSGLPVVMAYNLMAGILRSLGDGKSPLLAMIVASLVNIALDVLFVMGFGWGVASAAAATIIAQVCSCIFCLIRLRRLDILKLKRSDFEVLLSRYSNLVRMGLPIMMQNTIISVGGMIVQSVVNPLGVAFIAGYTATNKLYGILEMAAGSYGYAMTTYTGQNLGAKKVARIRKGVNTGLIVGVLTSLIIALFMFLFGRQIVTAFIDTASEGAADAIRIACEYLWTMSALLPVLYVLHIYRSSLQGMGNTVVPMLSGFAEFVMRTAAALLLPGLIGYWGVFWGEVLAWAGADLILVPGYFRMLKHVRMRYQHEPGSMDLDE